MASSAAQTPVVVELLARISRAGNQNNSAIAIAASKFAQDGDGTANKYNTTTPRITPSVSRGRTPRRTPGTGGRNVSNTLNSTVNQPIVVVAIVAGRGIARGEIGLAAIDLRASELHICQMSDTSAYTRLRTHLSVLQPVEIVVPDTAVERGSTNMSQLLEMLQEELPRTQITTINRKYFNDTTGQQQIDKLSVKECSALTKDLHEKYYCLAAIAALVKYVEFIQNMAFAPASVKINYRAVEQTCMIDPTTIKHLELIVSLKQEMFSSDMAANSDKSLFGMLNATFTASGGRLLRSSLLQPPTDVDVINERLDAIDELLADEQVFINMRSIISRLVDVDHLITLCVHMNKTETLRSAEHKITQVIFLKHTLELIPSLRDCMSTLSSRIFSDAHDHVLCDNRLADIVERIAAVIDDAVRVQTGALNMRTQKCFAVKSGLNGLLDMSRRAYTDLIAKVYETASEEVSAMRLPFRTAYTIGWCALMIKSANQRWTLGVGGKMMNVNDLPHICINVVRKGNTVTCTTRNLMKLNDRINQSVNEIFMLSNVVVDELLASIREVIGCLYNFTESLAQLDMVCSLAHYASMGERKVTRPEFADVMAIKQGRHALLERHEKNVTPNDTYLSADSSFSIITGPNMAGKSTYLKQVCLIQIMAQAGCYVPAEYAAIRLCKQIFTRIGHNDDLNNNNSAFMLEMKDMAYIVENATADSLIVIDELGRSTATEEGIGICHAICEHIIRTRAMTIFATHFLDMTHMDTLYPQVENYHFDSLTERSADGQVHIVRKHAIFRGGYRGPVYGFEMSEVWGVPYPVITRATALAKELRRKSKAKSSSSSPIDHQRAMRRLAFGLMNLAKDVDGLDGDRLLTAMNRLGIEYNRECEGEKED